MDIATWNINSVRLRIELVLRYLSEARPDVLCLQEIKCNNDQFPTKAFESAGYIHQAVNGQGGHHGVATVSRIPFKKVDRLVLGGKDDARHVSVVTDTNITIHNFYVPSGGDEPDVGVNPKFAHKLKYLEEMRRLPDMGPRKKSILVGDLNVAPGENDVWSHRQLLKVVSHTPVETDALAAVVTDGKWTDVSRLHLDDDEKLYTWWSYRSRDWRASNRGRRLDHIWVSAALRKAATESGPDAYKIWADCRDWEKPSDHVPVSFVLKE
ncbi:MAG: exodeoxyribonuclease III [Pseudomonadota bacterium]